MQKKEQSKTLSDLYRSDICGWYSRIVHQAVYCFHIYQLYAETNTATFFILIIIKMLVYQTDYLTIDLETNEHWREMPLSITVQCNGKLRRTTQHISVQQLDERLGQSSMVRRDTDWRNYDVDTHSHSLICVLLQTFRDLWYELPLEYSDLQKIATNQYLNSKTTN